MSWGVLIVMFPASPSSLVMARILLLSREIVPILVIVTSPARSSPFVSLSMVTLLRLILPELLIDTSPD